MSISKTIKQHLWHFSNKRYSVVMANPQISMCERFDIPKLTKEQEQAVKDHWDWWPTDPKLAYYDYRVFSFFDKWNIDYIPAPVFDPYLLRCLNPVAKSRTYEDKSMMWNVFSSISQPVSPLRCINGVYFDSSNEPVDGKDSFSLLKEGVDYIIKPIEETCGGQGVKKFKVGSLQEWVDIQKSFNGGFVVQECLTQSSYTSILNPKSLNTFRVTTLNINGKKSVCNICLRCGGVDSIVDNVARGGSIVGVYRSGELAEVGYCGTGKILGNANVQFKGLTIPNMEEIVSFAFKAHDRIPNCGIVGWDIALDADNRPILIEANISGPGILYEQICWGPLFGDRTDEVVQYCKSVFNRKMDNVGKLMIMDY